MAHALQGVSLAADLPDEMLTALEDLRALAKRAGKAAGRADAPAETAGRLRAFANLARWLQLQVLGDPESADTGIVDELKSIYRDAFPKAGKAGMLLLSQTHSAKPLLRHKSFVDSSQL